MMSWPDGRDIEESDLRLGDELGRGGQGRVIRIEAPQQGYVFKQYIVSGAEPTALGRLVDLPTSLQPADQIRLHRQTAWPLARVLSKGILSGFIMCEIPARFFGTNAAGRPKLRELQYLLYEKKPAWGSIVPLELDRRMVLAKEFGFLVRLLHDQRLVIGDISMNNLLWSDEEVPGVFLLDCDGVRRLGTSPVLRQAETPDWEDPQLSPTGLDLASDRYKLALVIGRLLSRTPNLHPGPELPLLPGLPDRVAESVTEMWRLAAGPRDRRPDAQQWLMALSDRGEITLPAPPPVRSRPSIPLAELEGAPTRRRSISLRGRSAESG